MKEPSTDIKKIDTGQMDSANEFSNNQNGSHDQEGCYMVEKPEKYLKNNSECTHCIIDIN